MRGGVPNPGQLYAAYKGDEFLAIKSKKEWADEFNCSMHAIEARATPTRHREITGERGGIALYRIESEECQ